MILRRGLGLSLALLALAHDAARAEVIDRVAVSIGNQVITEAQIDTEVRLTELLNRENPDVSAAARKAAAGRLIQQALVRREMELSRYPLPARSDADASLKDIKGEYRSETEYGDALARYGVTEEELKERLWWQLTVLRFIDYRFRPGIQVSDAEIKAYYDEQLPTWRKEGKNPQLNDVRDQIDATLTERRVDENMDRWLVEARSQVSIRYRDEALK